jgi:hypothetical protein
MKLYCHPAMQVIYKIVLVNCAVYFLDPRQREAMETNQENATFPMKMISKDFHNIVDLIVKLKEK